jgi:translation initiation factor IF-2
MAQKKHTQGYDTSTGGAPLTSGLKLPGQSAKNKLEVVLKCDTFGTAEAVSTILNKVATPEVDFRIIHLGVGPVSKSDLLMAVSGSKLVLCFQVGITPREDQWARENQVEIRIYDVIYKMVEDVKNILKSLVETEPEEKITGRGKIIALFKTSKGIIMGCEVQEGTFAVGKTFRIISAMGPVYTGRIDSLHIEKSVVREAKKGQQVGLKLTDFKTAQVGDLVECFEPVSTKKHVWKPSGKIIRMTS